MRNRRATFHADLNEDPQFHLFSVFLSAYHVADTIVDLVAKSPPALCAPVDCSPLRPLSGRISQGRILEPVAIFQRSFLTHEWNPSPPVWQVIFTAEPPGSPPDTGWTVKF